MGGTRRNFFVGIISKENDFMYCGFTPHLFLLQEIENGICKYKMHCCIDGCDIDITTAAGGKDYVHEILDVPIKEMPLSDWNALIYYKRDKSYFLSTKSYRQTKTPIKLLR